MRSKQGLTIPESFKKKIPFILNVWVIFVILMYARAFIIPRFIDLLKK